MKYEKMIGPKVVTLTTPLPDKRRVKPLTVEIDQELLRNVKLVSKAKGITLRQVVEYGLKTFLETSLDYSKR